MRLFGEMSKQGLLQNFLMSCALITSHMICHQTANPTYIQVREQYPWLSKYRNDWPVVAIVKQYLKNNRNKSRRKARDAATKAAAATTTDD